ncbi:helix-turn-helix domain-containing protein [Nocardioides solisilvae]|uniref:helix-turn-helix domain-containing protein n=1 Tax=Nocardioides solisilvae TaxID=1542435 RepID=UPI0013A584A2|nr:XRE family transcriptional regulator [Nocardioides solisilvae]
MSAPAAGFADVLRDAIERRGLGLERIRDHLAQRGVSLSVATLSYWQSGRSRPERKSSLAALPHLERVLEVPPGTLHASLGVTHTRRRRAPVVDLDALWPGSRHERVLARLDATWDTELDRLSVHDRLVVGADRRQSSLVVRQVLRARGDGPDRRVVLHFHDDTAATPPRIRALRGCTLGRTASDAERGVVGSELLFLRPLLRGETVVLEYELASPDHGPLESAYGRKFRTPTTDYLLEVEFAARALPTSCSTMGEPDEQVPLALDPAHRVHLVGSGLSTAGIAWSWDDDEADDVGDVGEAPS